MYVFNIVKKYVIIYLILEKNNYQITNLVVDTK